MSDKLKPCPFCGSGDITVGYLGQPATEFYAECVECGATGPARPSASAAGGAVSPDLAAKWNARHITAANVPPEVRREIEAAALERLADEYDTVVSDSATVWQIRGAAERLRGDA